jgi:uncharacterized protein
MNYFDASALVKRYVRETGTPAVRRLLREDHAATSRLSEAEISSALCRRQREGILTAGQYRRALDALRADLDRLEVIELSPHVVAAVHPLLARHRLRAGDALQLASALFLREAISSELALVAYDQRLRMAAQAEGLRVLPRTLAKRRRRSSS